MADSDSNKDVNITYDTLFELLRREKNREELQQLPPAFYSDVISYLREKDAILRKPGDENVFSSEEKEKTQTQLENVKKIIKELYDKRERKIVEMAIFKSRTNSNIINTSNLLSEEKLMFESLIAELSRFRIGVLLNVLSNCDPYVAQKKEQIIEPQQTTQKLNEQDSIAEPKSATNVAVRFVSPVPKFVGKELEVYGPFEKEEIASLPSQIADILIRKGRAHRIEA